LSESLTTPGPVELARVLSSLVEQRVTAISMEVSSHALDQGRVQALRFDAAVFTNLTRDHLDYHGTLDAYREAKRTFVKLLRTDGTAVINADDAAWSGLEQQAPHAIRFTIDNADAELRAEDIDISADGSRFVLVSGNQRADVDLPLVGDYNVQNALGAAGACIALGYGLDEIASLLGTLPQVPGRLEKIHSNEFTVLRDYAHTPDALENVLNTLRPVTNGRLIVLFGAGGDRDRGKRPEMGAVAQRLSDVAIVTRTTRAAKIRKASSTKSLRACARANSCGSSIAGKRSRPRWRWRARAMSWCSRARVTRPTRSWARSAFTSTSAASLRTCSARRRGHDLDRGRGA
jgi:UDP-N-acetylmuramoyl-L-alanyl-D-glutamate--2,6-diaminopimelate ligase